MRIGVLGAGAWGTALAVSLAPRHSVTLWARDAEQAAAMQAGRSNPRYLPDTTLPDALTVTANLAPTLAQAELLLIATPMAALRATLQRIAALDSPPPVVWLCKGFEANSALLPHQVAAEILPPGIAYGVLSGPSFAQEVAQGLPTALTLAAANAAFARDIACALHHPRLRIYASDDLIGVEVGGAVKNVLAIAAGIAEGLGFGHNARAALISRGLAEITRLGLRLGGRAETLGGLSGAGDLILTCTGNLSRNRQVGLLLAQNLPLTEILQRLGHVAEGVYTTREVQRLAEYYQVEMPICQAVYRILYQDIPAAEAVNALLNRVPIDEFWVGSLSGQ